MKRMRKLLFITFVLIYSAGLFLGAMREVKMPKQAEIYEYLGNSVSGYSTGIKDGIKSVAKDNTKTLALMLLGTLCKPLSILIFAAIGIKGYFTGFSVMAALRLYGIKGILMCGANLISSAVVIPAAAYFGSVVIDEMFINPCGTSEYRKKFLAVSFFLAAILCADSLAKGCLTSVFMTWASRIFQG